MALKKVNIIYKYFGENLTDVYEETIHRTSYLEKLLLKKGYEIISDETKKVDILFYSDYYPHSLQTKLVNKFLPILDFFPYKKMLKKHREAVKVFISGENVKGLYVSISSLLALLFYYQLSSRLGLSFKFLLFQVSFFSRIFFSLNFLHRIKSRAYGYVLPFEKNTFLDVPYKEKNNLNHPYFFYHGFINPSKLKKKKTTIVPEKFCFFAVSGPFDIDRIKFFLRLSRYKKIDSFGLLFNNTGNLKDRGMLHENYKKIESYKFVICFENSHAENYITEKIFQAVMGSAIPIYRGAPNIGEYFNTKSFINYEDCGSSYAKMLERVIELDQDDEKYLEMLNEPFLLNDEMPKSYLAREKTTKAYYAKVYDAFKKKRSLEG